MVQYAASDDALPTARHLEYLDWELGLFLHFGIRSFYEGHRDWDNRPMDPAAYNPVLLDCDQWMAIAKEAGVKYAVLTAKHHDGFANWPSKYTDYSIKSTPFRGGEGDVVREYVDAARRHGILPGLYYSPAQWGGAGGEMSSAKDYDDYFINQISELLTGYGDLHVLWFDGCGSAGHTYDWPRILAEIRRLQPNMLLAHLGDPDIRWIGNEVGIAPEPVWNPMRGVPCQKPELIVDNERPRFLPAECDFMMRDHAWFFEQGDRFTAKSPEELLGIYDLSVGRGANMLVNIGPDRTGLLPEPDASNLVAFGRRLRERFAHPLARTADFQPLDGEPDARLWKPEQPLLTNCVVLQEDMTRGQRIERFAIRAEPYHIGGTEPVTLYEGKNPGHKAVCHFPLARVAKICVEVTSAQGEWAWRSIEAHRLS